MAKLPALDLFRLSKARPLVAILKAIHANGDKESNRAKRSISSRSSPR